MFELLGLFLLVIGTIMSINSDFGKPVAGATRSSKLQIEERQRLIEEAIQAGLANTADGTAQMQTEGDESNGDDGQ